MRCSVIYLTVIFLFVVLIGECQESRQLMLKTWITSDSVMLRWAPTNFDAWQKANKYGYKVERLLLNKKGIIPDDNRMNMLHDGVIKPLIEIKWQAVVQKDSIWAPIALQALWGDTFELTSTFKTNIIQAYNKVRENETRFGFALFCADRSISVAKALGLYISDRSYSKQDKYIYRVYVNAPSREEGLDTAYVVVDPNLTTEAYRPMRPSVTRMGKSNLLTWRCSSNDYVGYHVERSFNGKNYTQISRDLVIPLKQGEAMQAFYSDSLVRGETDYFYRIVGLTPFGFMGECSDTVKIRAAMGIASPIGVEAMVTKQGHVVLTWKYEGEIRDIKEFRIARSSAAVGDYLPISGELPSSSRRWEDAVPLSNGYYKVIALSKDEARGESLEAFASLVDDNPPVPPVGLQGTVDTLGIVHLKWTPNKELDLMGYRIFRGNSANGEFVQVNRSVVVKACFVDTITIRTLTPRVYYRLAAVDKRYNSSNFSNTYALRRPDIIAPAPPILRGAEHVDDGVKLYWIPSPSDDVREIRLYRSSIGGDSVLLGCYANSQGSVLDSTRTNGRSGAYVYWCSAADSAGNRSTLSNTITVNPSKRAKAGGVLLIVKVLLVEGKPEVRLEWNHMADGQKVLLYKKENEGGLVFYKVFGDGSQFFIDECVVQGSIYEYRISAEGQVSKVVKVTI